MAVLVTRAEAPPDDAGVPGTVGPVNEELTTAAGAGSVDAVPTASPVAAAAEAAESATVAGGSAAETLSLLVGVPDGGGLRQAFDGLSTLRVPSPRSVCRSAGSLVLLLVSLMLCVVGVDAVLGSVLTGTRLRLASFVGLAGLAAAIGSLALLLGTALDGPTQPRLHVERHPRRLAAGLLLLGVSAVCALLWVRGVAVR
jgi:hypothetical protein